MVMVIGCIYGKSELINDTFSQQGPGIMKCDAERKGLIPRVVEGLFEMINSSQEATKYSVKLSMV